MREFRRHHRGAVLLGLLALAAVWILWYARPVDIHFLLGRGQKAAFIDVYVNAQDQFPHSNSQNYSLAAGDPKAEALMKSLEAVRFHRSPLEPLLRLLPPADGGSKAVEPEEDYIFYLFFSTEDWESLQNVRFWIDEWSYGPYGKLPLHVFHSQETGRELGTLLAEISPD